MEYKKINELTAVVTGGTPSTRKNEYWDNGDIPWLQSGCCQNCDVDSTEKYITKEGYNNSSTHMMSADTVMIALTGATAGKVGYLKFEACGNQSITGILPCESLNQRYLFFYLLSQREKILADCVGGAQAHISQSYVKNMTIPILAIKEQEQIVGELTKLSNIVSLRQEEIQQLDNLVKARFVEMFGDPRSNPFGFEKKRLKDTCKVITGNTPSRAIEEYYGDYIEWIKTDNIVSGILNPTQATESLSEKGMNVGRTVEKDSILMACIAGSIASIGRVCITDRTVAFNQQINAVVPEQYNILFLYVLFQMSKDYLVEDINMALKGILSKSKLEEKEFIIPPMDLQEQFSDFVKQVDKSKVAVQKALDETQILFDSLMQKYFG